MQDCETWESCCLFENVTKDRLPKNFSNSENSLYLGPHINNNHPSLATGI